MADLVGTTGTFTTHILAMDSTILGLQDQDSAGDGDVLGDTLGDGAAGVDLSTILTITHSDLTTHSTMV